MQPYEGDDVAPEQAAADEAGAAEAGAAAEDVANGDSAAAAAVYQAIADFEQEVRTLCHVSQAFHTFLLTTPQPQPRSAWRALLLPVCF